MMPPESGWFAGRAVAVAMVETEYFFWMDDDFSIPDSSIFAEFLRVIDTSGFDIIAGATQVYYYS